VIVLTAAWHERDTQGLVAPLDATVFAPPPDNAQDPIDKFDITEEQAGDGSPDLRWLRTGGQGVRWYAAGERLVSGIEAYAGRVHNDLVLWTDGARRRAHHRIGVDPDLLREQRVRATRGLPLV
jgi:hypothetical protein